MRRSSLTDGERGSPTAYDSFALAYDLYWGPASLSWLRPLSVLLIPRLSRHARLLDLCCGTGVLAAELTRRGYRMVGLDGSRAMLRHARTNAAGVPLVQADARRFGLRQQFDGVLCVFDSLNHLLSPEELRAAFSCVAACLRPGGWFLFDLNTTAGYLLHWNGRQNMGGSECLVRTRSRYDERSRRAVFTADISSPGAEGRIDHQVVLHQRCHSHGEVLAALAAAGFGSVETYGLEGDALAAGTLDQAERAFYLCRRPLSARQRGGNAGAACAPVAGDVSI